VERFRSGVAEQKAGRRGLGGYLGSARDQGVWVHFFAPGAGDPSGSLIGLCGIERATALGAQECDDVVQDICTWCWGRGFPEGPGVRLRVSQ
jgi:hypothetical protein